MNKGINSNNNREIDLPVGYEEPLVDLFQQFLEDCEIGIGWSPQGPTLWVCGPDGTTQTQFLLQNILSAEFFKEYDADTDEIKGWLDDLRNVL